MKVRNVLILVLALIIVSFFAGRYSTSCMRSAQYDEISQLSEVMVVYQREINGRDQTIYEKNQIIASKKEAIEAGIIEKDLLKALNLKSVRQITKISAEFSAYKDSLELDSVVFVTDTVFLASGEAGNNTYAKLPFFWEYSDEYLNLNTGIRENKQAWFDIDVPINLSITLGGKNGKQVAAVYTANEYVRVLDFNVVQMQEERWIYKPWPKYVTGGVGGLAIGYLLWGR